MPIDLACGRCQKLLRVPDEAAGKQARCPNCQSLTEVPLTAVEVVDDGAPSYVPPGMYVPSSNADNAYRSPAPFGPATGDSPFAAPRRLGDDAAVRMLLPVGRSLWAIAAGYLGLFSAIFIPAPLAIIVSLIAIWDIRTHTGKHGLGRAIFGLVMGLLGSAGLAIGIIAALSK